VNLSEIKKYWLKSSNEAFKTAQDLFESKRYSHAMFFLHLSVEKALKALYVNNNQAEAPFGHNLQNIAEKINYIKIDDEKKGLLAEITTFNISARYDDYKMSFYKMCTKKFAKEYLNKAEELLKWLQSQMK